MTLLIQLDDFQLETLRFLDAAQGRAVLADPMGARKTGTTLTWLAGRLCRTLVVAPLSVHGHWQREAARFHPDAVVTLGRGSKGQRQALLGRVSEPEHQEALYITTYEGMKLDQSAILKAGFTAVVFDEGHRLKGRRTQVALSANAVTKKARHIICATGTPVLNHAAELWQYLHMLAPKVYPAFWSWAEEHFRIELRNYRGNRFPTRIIHGFREGHEEIVRNQIAPFFIQREIAELFPGAAWVEEPEHVEIGVELTPPERKLYSQLVKHNWGVAGSSVVTTRNALDLTTRLSQVVSEWGSLDDSLSLGAKASATVELTLDLLERDEQVLIFAKYKATVDRIANALVDKHVQVRKYTGDSAPEDRDLCVHEFVKGNVKVLVGTLDSLSEGVDGLQHAASNVVMVDRWWVPAKNDQAIGRLRRSGQVKRVTVYHVFASDTIDAAITGACLRKVNVIESLMGRPVVDAIYGRVNDE